MPLVLFTCSNGKIPLAIESTLILYVGKGQGGLVTKIQTGITTPQGIMGFEVMETVEEVVAMVRSANGQPPLALADRPSGLLAG